MTGGQDGGTFRLPRELTGDGELFLLKVAGDMSAEGIIAGDWVTVRQQANIEDGQVAAVLIDGEAVLVTSPLDPATKAIVLGQVVAVMRRLGR